MGWIHNPVEANKTWEGTSRKSCSSIRKVVLCASWHNHTMLHNNHLITDLGKNHRVPRTRVRIPSLHVQGAPTSGFLSFFLLMSAWTWIVCYLTLTSCICYNRNCLLLDTNVVYLLCISAVCLSEVDNWCVLTQDIFVYQIDYNSITVWTYETYHLLI